MRANTTLITGASGFIGANLVRRLLDRKSAVHILIRKDSNLWRIRDILKYIHTYEVDFNEESSLKEIVRKIKPQYIYHLGAYGGYPFQKDIIQMIQTNILFTTYLLESLLPIDYKVFINTGSSSEYGYKKRPMKESDALAPASFYAATKAGATYLCQVYTKVYGKPITTVRPFSVYGPFEEGTRLIPHIIMSCLKNEEIKLTPGSESRDFVYIEDFIDGLLRISEMPQKVIGRVINLGSAKQYTVREVVELIRKLTASKSKLLWGRYKPRSWDTNYWVSDNTLALRYIGWKPAVHLEEGLSKSIAWFKKNNDLYEGY